ncbi:MAG: tyrosine-type recombinase/integrase [Anaerolineaceae bacterium]|jgi:integrase/recombinase XerC/integrase/recombinase XerD
MKHIIRETLIKEEIFSFLVAKKGQKLSNRSIDFYKDMLDEFCDYCESRGATLISEVTSDIIRDFMVSLCETHNGGGVHCYYRCIRAFLNWYELETDGEIPNPIKKIKPPKVNTTPIQGVSVSDVNAMILTCDKSFLGLRDKAILRSLLDTGLRAAEFCNLTIGDVNLETGVIEVIAGKGGKDRTVFLTDTSRTDIIRYMRRRNTRESHEPLWISYADSGLTPSGLTQLIRRRAKMANLKTIPSPHDFRRAFALESLRRGCDLIRLMKLMGHSSTQVLQRYLALQVEDLHDAYKQMGSRW